MPKPAIRLAFALVGAGALVALSACSTGSPSSSSSSDLVIGTTDAIVSLDPAGAWDRGSFTPEEQIYQHLLSYENGSTTPVPDAAKSCEFSDPTTYSCVVKDGLKFSNGDALTNQDVVYSFERILKINNPNGPGPLAANLASVEEGDGNSVVFHLKVANDQTWPSVLTSMVGPIVDHKVFPADALLADAKVIGSGPYQISSYTKGGLLSLTKNKNYTGADKPKTARVVLKPYTSSTNLALDIKKGTIDVAYRTLTTTDVDSLASDKSLQQVQGPGGEVRFLTFNVNTQPGANAAQKLAIRQAAAYLIDRQALADEVYKGTYAPAYSLVLDGQPGAIPAFKDQYGATPDAAKAKAVLAAAGVTTPVALPIQYTTDHYGPGSDQEYAVIKSQLEAGGLFSVSLQSTEWTSYVKQFDPKSGYPAYQLGLFPDYPDPDSYLRSAYSTTGSAIANGFSDPAVDALITAESTETDTAKRADDIAQIEKLTAQSASVIPLLQGKETVIASKDVTGLSDTLDATFLFRFSALAKKQ